MNDLMCNGIECPIREGCLRFEPSMDMEKDYFLVPPYNPGLRNCDEYIDAGMLPDAEDEE